MGGTELTFEPGDWAGLVWLAVGVLALAEVVRYLSGGRRPASVSGRVAAVGTAAAIMAVPAIWGGFRLSHIPHAWACLILGALTLNWVRRSYSSTTRPLKPGTRLCLVSLRMAAALVALLMLARPVLLSTSALRERAVVGILLDSSSSMNVRDVVQPGRAWQSESELLSRLEAVTQALETSRSVVDHLADRVEVLFMSFDSRVRRMNGPLRRAEGGVTAISRAVNDAREILVQTGARVDGLVLVSDGRDTSSSAQDPAAAGDELAVAGIPLYCLGVGSELPVGQTRSLSGRRLDMPDRVTVLNRLDVGAEFLAAGLVGVEVDVRLEYDGQTVATTKIVPRQMRELIRAELSHVVSEGGLHRVQVVAEVPDLGRPQGQARLARYVRVTDDKVQVLYIDRARYERAAVARALEYARDINLTKIDLTQPAGSPGPAALPDTAEFWRAFHVVIIGDVAREQLPEGIMKRISQLVTAQGRGAAMLGGVRTVGSGDYAGTALDLLFPVNLAVRGQTDGAVHFKLSPAGRLHPCLQSGEAGDEPWRQLPPFAGASRLGPVETAAEVLLVDGGGEPLMVAQQKGAGRVAVLGFDSTWQWALASDQGLELHRRFWRQLVLWLANRKPEVWVLADRSQYDLARLEAADEQVVVRAGVTDPGTGGMHVQSGVSGELIGPDGKKVPLTWEAAGDGFEAKPAVRAPGKYRVRVQGTVGPSSAGDAETGFVVESLDRELSEPFADLEALQRLAARTAPVGGGYAPLSELPEILERIRAGSAEARAVRFHRSYLVDDHPWFWLGCFLGLLIVEWIVRRRAGLV